MVNGTQKSRCFLTRSTIGQILKTFLHSKLTASVVCSNVLNNLFVFARQTVSQPIIIQITSTQTKKIYTAQFEKASYYISL